MKGFLTLIVKNNPEIHTTLLLSFDWLHYFQINNEGNKVKSLM